MKQVKYPERDDVYETSITGIKFVVTHIDKNKGRVWLQLLKGEDKKKYPFKIETFYEKDLVKVKE